MRYIFKTPNHGDTKVKKKFLFFPVIIDEELRWLETATIKYKFDFINEKWYPIEFIDEKDGDIIGGK